MPRVSDEHLASRRRQIMEAAARCFANNGFHRTSMQDVFRESGLSAGAVYRYFRSKDELVRAIADETVGAVSREVEELIDQDPIPPLSEVLGRFLRIADRYATQEGPLRLAVQVWGESVTDPKLAEMVREKYDLLRGHFIKLAARAQDAGQLPADQPPELVGRALFSFLPGYILQHVLLRDVDAATYAAGVAALLPAAARASP